MAADLLVFIRMLIYLIADFGCVMKNCARQKSNKSIVVYVHFLLARQSHQAPRCVTVPILLLVGIIRVYFLYLTPKICKYQIFSTNILYSSCRKKYAYQRF